MKSVLAVVGSVVAALLGVGVLAQAPQHVLEPLCAWRRPRPGRPVRTLHSLLTRYSGASGVDFAFGAPTQVKFSALPPLS